MQKAIKINDIAIVSIKRNDYRINFWCISMDETISKMKIFDLKGQIGLMFGEYNVKRVYFINLSIRLI